MRLDGKKNVQNDILKTTKDRLFEKDFKRRVHKNIINYLIQCFKYSHIFLKNTEFNLYNGNN